VSGKRGYTLVAVVIFMFLLSISLMAVVPTVSKIMQRDKEEELIFRGKQYAQAMLNFQKRQGRYPLDLKELMQTRPRSARKLFKEPMCNCDDWGLIRAGEPWPKPKPVKLDSVFGDTTFPTPETSTSPATPGSSTGGAPISASTSSKPAFGLPAAGEEKSNRPIIGVYSKIHLKGIRTFKGKEYYDEWGFIAGQNNDDLPGNQIPGGKPPGDLLNPNKAKQPIRTTTNGT
jgi:type II secretory pathway pseudopilin PulG